MRERNDVADVEVEVDAAALHGVWIITQQRKHLIEKVQDLDSLRSLSHQARQVHGLLSGPADRRPRAEVGSEAQWTAPYRRRCTTRVRVVAVGPG